MTFREALLAMSYREEKDGRWAKPVGYVLFTFLEEANQWSNWFRDLQGKLSRWNHINYVDGKDPLFFLKECEAYTRIDVGGYGSKFELSGIDL